MIDPAGHNAGKKADAKKRHPLSETLGQMLSVVVHPASLQDRDVAVLVLNERIRRLFPYLEKTFADRAFGGPKLRRAIASATPKIEVVKRPPDQ